MTHWVAILKQCLSHHKQQMSWQNELCKGHQGWGQGLIWEGAVFIVLSERLGNGLSGSPDDTQRHFTEEFRPCSGTRKFLKTAS